MRPVLLQDFLIHGERDYSAVVRSRSLCVISESAENIRDMSLSVSSLGHCSDKRQLVGHVDGERISCHCRLVVASD